MKLIKGTLHPFVVFLTRGDDDIHNNNFIVISYYTHVITKNIICKLSQIQFHIFLKQLQSIKIEAIRLGDCISLIFL